MMPAKRMVIEAGFRKSGNIVMFYLSKNEDIYFSFASRLSRNATAEPTRAELKKRLRFYSDKFRLSQEELKLLEEVIDDFIDRKFSHS